ncbi:hypothetical protein N825_08800 [Skermanella stibiiresistens SB22]|uniref:FAD-binding domain-containing protein n=1 Tax=Skermanella stibiiresistens SB22 TaxID=1385369 RepID=W9H2Z4_9PROT|nr:NAD(P)/FAD-dependent oxidoreductase [Skermanella stibiiresistens]EWY39092.1 hypothetical protein N825_08800 [Skermanella stibiiresistens SB22]
MTRIAIVGAGVSGAIVAQGLQDLPGVEVFCVERVAVDDHSQAGTGLNVGPNALKALGAFLPDIHDTVVANSLPWRHWRISLTDGTELMDLPLDRVADNPGIRIRWSELYALLRRPILDRILFDTEVDAMRHAGPDERGPLVLDLTNRRTGETRVLDGIDLLIGGDGRYSRVRETFLGRPEPIHVGVCIFRLLVETNLGPALDDYEQWFNGPNRLLAFQVPGGATYIAGSFPIPPGGEIPDDHKRPETLRRLYTPEGREPSPACRFMIDQISANAGQIHWARLQETAAEYRDESGHVLLLGDAAHPMVPTLGQGATQAIEDACVTVGMLRRHLSETRPESPPDIRAAVLAIEAARRDRVAFAAGFSRDATDTMLAGADPVAGTLKKTGPDFLDRLRRLYRDVPNG